MAVLPDCDQSRSSASRHLACRLYDAIGQKIAIAFEPEPGSPQIVQQAAPEHRDEEPVGAYCRESIDASGNSPAALLIDDHETGPRGVCQRNDLRLATVKLGDQQRIGFRGIDDPSTPNFVVESGGTGPPKSVDAHLAVDCPRANSGDSLTSSPAK